MKTTHLPAVVPENFEDFAYLLASSASIHNQLMQTSHIYRDGSERAVLRNNAKTQFYSAYSLFLRLCNPVLARTFTQADLNNFNKGMAFYKAGSKKLIALCELEFRSGNWRDVSSIYSEITKGHDTFPPSRYRAVKDFLKLITFVKHTEEMQSNYEGLSIMASKYFGPIDALIDTLKIKMRKVSKVKAPISDEKSLKDLKELAQSLNESINYLLPVLADKLAKVDMVEKKNLLKAIEHFSAGVSHIRKNLI